MNQRFMLDRHGESPTWQEMLSIGLAISSILNMLAYGMWPAIVFKFTVVNAVVWVAASLFYYFLGTKPKKNTLYAICLAYAFSVSFLPGIVFTVLGIVVGTLMSIYIGKDLYQSPKEEK